MNSFGRIFRVQIFGESHGEAVGVVIDGCPPGLALEPEAFVPDLDRRRPGKKGTTSRTEDDTPLFRSGRYGGYTTGAPLTIWFENRNARSSDYEELRSTPRPGHADLVADRKFAGFNDPRGGGHFSGRLTVALVAAGVVAKKVILPLQVQAGLIEAGGLPDIDKALDDAMRIGDSIGGIVECRISGVPIGLGEPFFDSVESLISHAVFAIPAVKGIEFGAGFRAAGMKGSEHNDAIIDSDGRTATNNSGGINGGLSNGNDILFRVAVKPTSSTPAPQQTWNSGKGRQDQLKIGGRHDLCIALRVPVVVEAVAALVLADLVLISNAGMALTGKRP